MYIELESKISKHGVHLVHSSSNASALADLMQVPGYTVYSVYLNQVNITADTKRYFKSLFDLAITNKWVVVFVVLEDAQVYSIFFDYMAALIDSYGESTIPGTIFILTEKDPASVHSISYKTVSEQGPKSSLIEGAVDLGGLGSIPDQADLVGIPEDLRSSHLAPPKPWPAPPSEEVLTKEEALFYVGSKAERANEWVEAALYDLLWNIIMDKVSDLTTPNLDELIRQAESN